VKTSPFDQFVPAATIRVDTLIDNFGGALAQSSKNDGGKAAFFCFEDIARNHQLNGFNLRSRVYHYKI
jgi:hypothetical protein